MVSSHHYLPFGRWGFAGSLLPVGQWVYDKSREILNTGGVSSQWLFVLFVRFVFLKITVNVCIGLWGFAESRVL